MHSDLLLWQVILTGISSRRLIEEVELNTINAESVKARPAVSSSRLSSRILDLIRVD